LGSYLLFLGVAAWVFLSSIRTLSRSDSIIRLHLVRGLTAGWASILVTNFFGFSVVIVQLFLFLLPAASYVLSHDGSTAVSRFKLKPLLSSLLLYGSMILVIYLLGTLISFWRADTLFARGYRYNRLGQYQNAKEPLERAVGLNPGEPLYRDELAGTLAPLTLSLYEQKEASQASRLAQEAIMQSDTALSISPNNVNFWRTRTKIFYTFSDFSQEFTDAAIQALTKAKELSPNDPRILYNLAILYGRKGDSETALSLLKAAKTIKPNYRDAYYGLYVFYTELEKPELANAELTEYLTKVDPNDQEFSERLKN
jgi:tetratricopeptide (TPR) repeat protein